MRFVLFCLVFFISAASLWSVSPKERVDTQAQTALDQGDFLGARDLYETYLKIHGDDADVLAWLGGVYGMMADPLGQERVCLRALHINPEHIDAFINLGNAECALEEWGEAERSYLSAYGIAREKGTAAQKAQSAYALSNFYLARPTQDNDAALTWANACLSHIGEDVKKGRSAPASKDTEIAHRAEITVYKMATLNKASALINKGDHGAATHVLTQYLEVHPKDNEARQMLNSLDEHRAKALSVRDRTKDKRRV